ncbi:3',5'-cyclic AMP phosphodiesterase CpdA [Sporobacter termitidis DSM 10068]|uniref:3',5'-cyclic AMP phosphodiesterase CpdA n=1 Tax=Sporobacter termitidis DSM 10068 TaxID=1123282 RepID=A0A1M5XDN4_9FIRM|nr:S-layer homology domain-containing protein [Sporobacter termitidis]SHH97985.1 3',5'-cyclic AMP phosphodiesterase CpdA [Sporobacter termitidis DSM 10068]
MKNKTFFKRLTAFAAVLGLLGALAGAGAASDALPKNIILSWTGDTKTTMTVSWQTPPGVDESAVQIGTAPALTDARTVAGTVTPPKSGIPLDFNIFRAEIAGLAPGTTYYYRVGGDGTGWSAASSFATRAADDSGLAFLYMGDIHMGVGEESRWKAMADTAGAKNPDIAFGMFGGDIVDSGINAGQWESVLKDASPLFSKIPLMPVNGNHESNFPSGKPELYLDMFALPENGPDGFKKEFYSFDAGSCHVTVLNSWVYSGEQKLSDSDYQKINKWISDDLASSRAAWKIVVMHHPVYALASDKVVAAVKKNWEPLFEQGGVSLVLCGHQHVYNRSYPMRDGEIDYENGITYVMGNASQKFYSSADETYSEKTIYNVSNYQIIRVDGDRLTIQSFDETGKELDYAALSPVKGAGSQGFADVDPSSWYAAAVGDVTARGVLSGTGGTLFSPDMPMTRAMFVTALYRAAGSPGAGRSPAAFTDVDAGQWYYDAAAWAADAGIAQGYGGAFAPDGTITREQLAAMLYRYAKPEEPVPAADASALAAFSDGGEVSDWAKTAVAWAAGSGLLHGSGGRLAPGDTATRAQAAQVLYGFLQPAGVR